MHLVLSFLSLPLSRFFPFYICSILDWFIRGSQWLPSKSNSIPINNPTTEWSNNSAHRKKKKNNPTIQYKFVCGVLHTDKHTQHTANAKQQNQIDQLLFLFPFYFFVFTLSFVECHAPALLSFRINRKTRKWTHNSMRNRIDIRSMKQKYRYT